MKNYETPLNVLLFVWLVVIIVMMSGGIFDSLSGPVLSIAKVEPAPPVERSAPEPAVASPTVVEETQQKQENREVVTERAKVAKSLKALQSIIPTPAEPAPKPAPLPVAKSIPPGSPVNLPSLLVEAAELENPDLASRVTVLDVRSGDKYGAKHVPGAVRVDLHEWAQAFTRRVPQAAWERRLGSVGIGLDTPIVICDDGSGQDAACLWAILRYWGVKNVHLLNGGWPAWLYAGAYQDNVEPAISQRALKARPVSARVVNQEQLTALIQSGREQIIDSRLTGRGNAGSSSTIRLEWNSVFDWRESRFFSANDLSRLFHSAGIDLGRPAVVYGDSLEQAATVAIALELAGAKKVQLHFPGWDR